MPTVLARIPALTCHFRMPAPCRRRPRHRVFFVVLDAEGLGGALVGGGRLAVDAGPTIVTTREPPPLHSIAAI